MRKYHDNNKSYNAIVEAMQQIRYNALVEEYGEDEMEEAYMYEEDEEEMSEMSDEEEQMVAEMMDEALYEMDMDDDEDNLNEADDGRKARRRKRLRQALLIGAGLAAAGLGGAGLGAAYNRGRGMRTQLPTTGDPLLQTGSAQGDPVGFRGILSDIGKGAGAYKKDFDAALGYAGRQASTVPARLKAREYRKTFTGQGFGPYT